MRSLLTPPPSTPTRHDPPRGGQVILPELLKGLFAANLILHDDWGRLPLHAQESLVHCHDLSALLERLADCKLLTHYQADRLRAGKGHGLVLGHYRVLNRLGAGGMGVVFHAEHVLLRRPVAVKVLAMPGDSDPRPLQRFFSEIRTLGAVQHPNVVQPLDAGHLPAGGPGEPPLHYLAMEYVEGPDLEEMVREHGPLPISLACELVRQAAAGLAAAQGQGLVHRDVKPSNIKVRPLAGPDGEPSAGPAYQVKLLDFGLAQDFRHRMTEPGVLLGTLDYVAPEQAQNAHGADIRADIYGLGGVLYWCLTGEVPFPAQAPAPQEILRRMSSPPPSARAKRPDVPPELDAVLARMLAPRPDERYATPRAVIRALSPFLSAAPDAAATSTGASHFEIDLGLDIVRPRVLLVDDEPKIRDLCRRMLRPLDAEVEEVDNGPGALVALRARPFDVVLLDMHLPGLNGAEVLKHLRADPPCPNLRVLVVSGQPADELAGLVAAGADDFLTKPFTAAQLLGRVQSALRLKAALDQAEQLTRHLQSVGGELEHALAARDCDLSQTRSALVLALAQVLGHRSTETEGHLVRVQHYTRLLAEGAARVRTYDGQIDAAFVRDLECCAPLHDIGIVALPDHILLKPGKLDVEERVVMQSHTTIGAEILEKVVRKYGTGVSFLKMAVELARSHHERWDGAGYPDRLAGEQVPLAARLLSLGDVYDALRSRRAHRPGLPHAAAVQVLAEGSPGQFDPGLLEVFRGVAGQFEAIYRQHADS